MLRPSKFNCVRCPLHVGRTNIVDGFGAPEPRLFLIMEAPGRQEDTSGYPAIGPAGRMVRTELAFGGILSQDLYVSNAAKCRPINPDNGGNRAPTKPELAECLPWLVSELDSLRCPTLLVLGNTAKAQVAAALDEIEDYSPRVFAEWHPAAFLHKPNPARKAAWAKVVRRAAAYAMGAVADEDGNALQAEPWTHWEDDRGAVNALLASNGVLSLDTETRPKGVGEPDTLVSWSLGNEREAVFFQHRDAEDEVSEASFNALHAVFDWCRDGGLLVGSNIIQYDYYVCEAAGIHVDGCLPNLRDTMIELYVGRHFNVGLKPAAVELCGMDMEDFKSVVGRGKKRVTFDQSLRDPKSRARAIDYACRDAVAGARVHSKADDLLSDTQRRYLLEIEQPLAPVLACMSQRGILIDTSKLGEVGAALDEEGGRLASILLNEWHLDTSILNAPAQLGPALKALGLPLTKVTDAGQLITDRDHLLESVDVVSEKLLPSTDSVNEQLTTDLRTLVSFVLAYRHTAKNKSTYVDGLSKWLDGSGRVHPKYRQAGSDEFGVDPTTEGPATGRISCADPNLLNIPKGGRIGNIMRSLFIPSPGMAWVRADCSQQELRIWTHYTQCPTLLEVFQMGQDIHQATAQATGLDRDTAKTGIYAMLYGAEAGTLAEALNVSRPEAVKIREKFLKGLPELRYYKDYIKEELESHGYVETAFGWRNYYPEYFSPIPRLQAEALRQACNLPIQGSGAGYIKKVQTALAPIATAYGGHTLLQVYDELNFEVPENNVVAFMQEMEVTALAISDQHFTVRMAFQPQAGGSWKEAS